MGGALSAGMAGAEFPHTNDDRYSLMIPKRKIYFVVRQCNQEAYRRRKALPPERNVPPHVNDGDTTARKAAEFHVYVRRRSGSMYPGADIRGPF